MTLNVEIARHNMIAQQVRPWDVLDERVLGTLLIAAGDGASYDDVDTGGVRTGSSNTALADGILDDETYDWQADFDVMRASAGTTIVVSEDAVERAWALAKQTGVNVSPTGSAGLAGLLPTASGPSVKPGERVAIVFSGVFRG